MKRSLLLKTISRLKNLSKKMNIRFHFRKMVFCTTKEGVVITTAQLNSIKPELRFCAGSNPARGVSEIRDGEDL